MKPILVIAYNRIEYAHDLFNVIRNFKPEKLYVSVDGAAPDDRVDFRKVLEVQCVFMPEWECDLQTRFNEVHLGKAKHVVSAINWFFENEPEGIILFDDCLPHPEFFAYCESLLDQYRDEPKVGHICGCNIMKKRFDEASYFFSAYPTSWGFATWRDRWQGFSLEQKTITPEDITTALANYQFKKKVPGFWIRRYRLLTQYPSIDVWEYQYFIHFWSRAYLSVVPAVNLVVNRGFSTKSKRRIRKLNRETHSILPLTPNNDMRQHVRADKFIFRRYFRKDNLTFWKHWLDENILND